MRTRSLHLVLGLAIAGAAACGDPSDTPTNDANTDIRCVAGVEDACPPGQACANERCKPVCPGPGGVGQSCGSAGSICCGVEQSCISDEQLACTDACTPFTGGCPDGFGCQVLSESVLEYSDCRVAGDGVQGASCTSDAECAPDFTCIGGSTPACHRYCLPDDPAHGCDAGTTCQSWQFLDGVLYGVCI